MFGNLYKYQEDTNMVSYKEHTKAQVLAALWNGSHAQGMSFFATIPTHTHMTEE